VHFLFTGCEEVGDYGMHAFLDAHASQLSADTLYVILDEVGLGQIKYLTADGLLFKRKTHPTALALARSAALQRPELGVVEGVGVAYTDALAATRRKLPALTICTTPTSEQSGVSHWHQMSDVVAYVNANDLLRTYAFTWQILQGVDQASA
jgi:Zn-dependent M28 family amino/carboxypeptidase